MTESQKKPLSRTEKFFLISGIIGLVADVIALVTFLTGLLNLDTHQGSANSFHLALFRWGTALLLVYTWFLLTWIIARRGLSILPEGRRRRLLEAKVLRGVIGSGVLLAPLAVLWWVAVIWSIIASADAPRQYSQSPEPQSTSETLAGPTVALPSAYPTSDIATPRSSPDTSVEEVQLMSLFMCLPVLYPALGGAIFFGVGTLMPLFYTDLA